MKAIARCNFRYKGTHYKAGASIELGDDALHSLEQVGLVSIMSATGPPKLEIEPMALTNAENAEGLDSSGSTALPVDTPKKASRKPKAAD